MLYSLEYILAVERIIHQNFLLPVQQKIFHAVELPLKSHWREHELSCEQQGKVRLIAAYTQTGRLGLRSKGTEDAVASKILRCDNF